MTYTLRWFSELAATQPVAYSVLILAGVAVLGLAIGQVRIRGIRLGVAGVLFAGILLGHLGLTIPLEMLAFVRDFGLILFVYTIGIQVGPGFFTSLRRQGLPLNLLAAGIVLGGALLTIASSRLLHIDMAAAVGIFAGATTNTPSLGAAQEALKLMPGFDPAQGQSFRARLRGSLPFGNHRDHRGDGHRASDFADRSCPGSEGFCGGRGTRPRAAPTHEYPRAESQSGRAQTAPDSRQRHA